MFEDISSLPILQCVLGNDMKVWVLQTLCNNKKESKILSLHRYAEAFVSVLKIVNTFCKNSKWIFIFLRERINFMWKCIRFSLDKIEFLRTILNQSEMFSFVKWLQGGRKKNRMPFWSTPVIGFCKSPWWSERDVGQDLLAQ